MEKRSKILLVVLGALIIVSIFLTYRRSYVTKDYEIIPISEDVSEEF